jgi:hypothetical protein
MRPGVHSCGDKADVRKKFRLFEVPFSLGEWEALRSLAVRKGTTMHQLLYRASRMTPDEFPDEIREYGGTMTLKVEESESDELKARALKAGWPVPAYVRAAFRRVAANYRRAIKE